MPKTKDQCPSCRTNRISFPTDILDLFDEIKREHRLKGGSTTNEKIVLKIIREWKFIKDNKVSVL